MHAFSCCGACRAASTAAPAEVLVDIEAPQPDPSLSSLKGLAYAKQYDIIYSKMPLNTQRPVPKPSKEEQAKVPGAHRVRIHCGCQGVTAGAVLRVCWDNIC